MAGEGLYFLCARGERIGNFGGEGRLAGFARREGGKVGAETRGEDKTG